VVLPLVAVLISGGTVQVMVTSVTIAIALVSVVLFVAIRYGQRLSRFHPLLAGQPSQCFLSVKHPFGLRCLWLPRAANVLKGKVRFARLNAHDEL